MQTNMSLFKDTEIEELKKKIKELEERLQKLEEATDFYSGLSKL